MSDDNMQETLDRVMKNLKSGEAECQLEAIRELEMVSFNSEAILLRLEMLALGENAEVRVAALNALNLKTSQLVSSRLSNTPKNVRQAILAEIDEWQADGLIEPHRAEVIRRHYDFDIQPGILSKAASGDAAPLGPVPTAPVPLLKPVEPAAPRPTLMQTLLSETSIKIYLYLGAFFVIIAAAILAALVEAARLPVLLITTTAFAAGAVVLKRRLPQPSFALAVVFSFLLPIDANVIADTLSLSARSNEVYWSVIFLLMAVIWGLGTWFYASRLFSLAAFLSLSLGFLRFGEIFNFSIDWNIFSVAIANLIGLLAVRTMKKWRDFKFAQPLFLFIQLQQAILLFISLGSVTIHLIDSAAVPTDWIAAALTWTASAAFYAASDSLVPFLFFPWTAVASLFLVPWLILSAFDASALVQIAGFAVWGVLAAFGSEFAQKTKRDALTKYHFPLLAESLTLFLVAIGWGLVEGAWYGLTTFLVAGIAYTVIHTLCPRWYIWLTALLAGLGTYFTFFTLPFMQYGNIHSTALVHATYQILGASLLLLIPELFFKGPFSFTRTWNWPPLALGSLLTAFNIMNLFNDVAYGDFGRSAIIFGVYALLFAAYALRFKQPVIGYLGTAAASLAEIFTLQHFVRDWWLPALTALAAIYYFAGYVLARREQTRNWSTMLINSGLALGTILSLVAVFALKETGGWYALIVAALFTVEMFTRRNGYLELFVEAILNIALIIILNDFEVDELAYYLFGLSLLWFASDAAFMITLPSRKLGSLVKGIGALFTFPAVIFFSVELASRVSVIYFGVYTLFFAAYAWLHKNPLFGYASTAAFALAIFFGLHAVHIDSLLFPLIAVAALYYAAGYFLRRADQAKGWDTMLLFSGLGLGTLVALAAPSQHGGLEKSIPIAIAATFYAAEAFARKNVWLGFPANILYLIAYFVILSELKVDEPQFFTVGAASLGLLQHYLLRRAGSKRAAFITGLVSQLVLLGASYIQMVDTGELKYFFLLFFQALVVLVYGIVVRSRSLIIAPIGFAVLAVVTVLYNALKDLSLVFIIGITGLILLTLGILAVVMRERITNLAERFGDWDA